MKQQKNVKTTFNTQLQTTSLNNAEMENIKGGKVTNYNSSRSDEEESIKSANRFVFGN